MKKIILFAATAVSTSLTMAQDEKQNEAAIKGLLTTLEKGWNARDGKAFSAAFAEKHDYIVVNGMFMNSMSRERNAMVHQNLFDGIYRKRDLRLNLEKINFIRPDLAMVYALGVGYDEGTPVPRDPSVIMSFLAEKKNDEWKIISFHNHNLEMEQIRQGSPMPVEVMYAGWYTQNQ